jgi:hypothetical protein
MFRPWWLLSSRHARARLLKNSRAAVLSGDAIVDGKWDRLLLIPGVGPLPPSPSGCRAGMDDGRARHSRGVATAERNETKTNRRRPACIVPEGCAFCPAQLAPVTACVTHHEVAGSSVVGCRRLAWTDANPRQVEGQSLEDGKGDGQGTHVLIFGYCPPIPANGDTRPEDIPVTPSNHAERGRSARRWIRSRGKVGNGEDGESNFPPGWQSCG